VKERQKKERGGKVDRFRFRRRKSGRMTLLRAAFEENDFEGASPPRKKPLKPFWSDEKRKKECQRHHVVLCPILHSGDLY